MEKFHYQPEFARYKLLGFDLEEIYMFCAVNCIENPYIANYINKRKQIEDEENANEREEISQYSPIISYDESGNKEEPPILYHKKMYLSYHSLVFLN